MDGKRRDRHEIIAEILNCTIRGKIKTHIMFKTKLSFAQTNEYIPLLVEKGFLENTTIKRRKQTNIMYRTTRKGIEFLKHLESANKLFP